MNHLLVYVWKKNNNIVLHNFRSYLHIWVNNFSILISKAWTAIDKLSIIWMSDLTDKMKRTGSGCVDTAIWMHHMDAYEAAAEEAGRKLYKNVESSIKQVLATTPHETPTIRTLAPHHKNYTSSTDQTRRTLLEKQGRAHKRCTPVDPHTWMCKSGTTSTNLHTAAMWGHGM